MRVVKRAKNSCNISKTCFFSPIMHFIMCSIYSKPMLNISYLQQQAKLIRLYLALSTHCQAHLYTSNIPAYKINISQAIWTIFDASVSSLPLNMAPGKGDKHIVPPPCNSLVDVNSEHHSAMFTKSPCLAIWASMLFKMKVILFYGQSSNLSRLAYLLS